MGEYIDQKKVNFPQKKQKDFYCRLFSWNDHIFRGIYPAHEAHFRTLLSSDFFTTLVSENYFPATTITDYQMDGFSLILEHEEIWPVVYPQEWTFSMLQDAAIMVLEIAQVAKHHRFNMKDCHGLNILFDGTTPRFVDLGSFCPNETPGWVAYEEFLRFYYYPLKIWRYNSYLGKLCIFSGNLISHDDYRRLQTPLFRGLNSRLLNRLFWLQMAPEVLAAQPASKWKGRKESGVKRRIQRALHTLVAKGIVPTNSLRLTRNLRRVRSIRQRRQNSSWGDYHQQIKAKEKRFNRILEIVNQLDGDLKTAVDIAGNQGKFTRLLIQHTAIRKAVCIDYDENAVDAGYRHAKADHVAGITFAHYDFMAPIVKTSWKPPHQRFQCDVAFALALTHHLLLSQKYDLDEILRNIANYAAKFVFVEFMPKGLWVSGAEVQIPSWYTREWFREEFSKNFNLIHEEQIAINNVLYVGNIKPTRGTNIS